MKTKEPKYRIHIALYNHKTNEWWDYKTVTDIKYRLIARVLGYIIGRLKGL
jgi:hypothetical protein